MPITDFIALPYDKQELTTALKVLKSFKECESKEEWLNIPFAAWSKLEQLEEFLEFRVHGEPLRPDTIAYIERLQKKTAQQKETPKHTHNAWDLNLTEWKPTAVDVTCSFFKCKGCHEQPRPTPCDRWYFSIIYYAIRLFNWR